MLRLRPTMSLRLAQFLVAASISVGISTVSSAADVRTRKHVDDMSTTEWTTLAKAIKALHDRDQKDANGKFLVPQTVDSYERFIQIHGNMIEAGACLHGSERIWFWHRAFLLHFENRLRATSTEAANITLPYWDWTEKTTGVRYPKAFEDPALLFHDKRLHTANPLPSPLTAANDQHAPDAKAFVKNLLKNPSWADFGGTIDGPDATPGSLESETHDPIHGGYISGDNRNTVRAVADPIFFAHHSNLDRLIDEWQAQHPATPAAPHCLDCNAAAYDRDATLGPLKVADLVSNSSVKGVKVVYAPRIAAVAMAEAAAPAPPSPSPQPPSGQATAFRLTIPAKTDERAVLVIPDVTAPAGEFSRGDVYLVPEGTKFTPDRAFKEKYRIGVVGTFSDAPASESAGHAHKTKRVAVRLGEALQKLPEQEKGKPYQLIIQFVPIATQPRALETTAGPGVTHGTPQLKLEGNASKSAIQLEKLGSPQ